MGNPLAVTDTAWILRDEVKYRVLASLREDTNRSNVRLENQQLLVQGPTGRTEDKVPSTTAQDTLQQENTEITWYLKACFRSTKSVT